MKSYEGVFEDWEFDQFRATHPDGYALWIANGLTLFADDDTSLRSPKPFLRGIRLWTRWRLWRALKAERRHRAYDLINGMAVGE